MAASRGTAPPARVAAGADQAWHRIGDPRQEGKQCPTRSVRIQVQSAEATQVRGEQGPHRLYSQPVIQPADMQVPEGIS